MALALAFCTDQGECVSRRAGGREENQRNRRLLIYPTFSRRPVIGVMEGSTVNVALQEWSVLPDPVSVPFGESTFHVTNAGPDDIHEFVVFKTHLAPDALPTAEGGSVDEEGEGVELKDEIEDIAVGDSQDVSISLAAGRFRLTSPIPSPLAAPLLRRGAARGRWHLRRLARPDGAAAAAAD